MIEKAINRAFIKAAQKKWDCLYFLIDLHETVLVPNFIVGEISTEFYPRAKEVLQTLSKRKDIVLIMFTCSWPEEIKKYLAFFAGHDIQFKYVNGNPAVKNHGYGYYVDKSYADVVLDDKAGFDHESDWDKVVIELAKHQILEKNE